MKKHSKRKNRKQFDLEYGCADHSLEYSEYDLHDMYQASVNKHDWFSLDVCYEYEYRAHSN